MGASPLSKVQRSFYDMSALFGCWLLVVIWRAVFTFLSSFRLGWLLVVSRNMEHRYKFLLYVLFCVLKFYDIFALFGCWLLVVIWRAVFTFLSSFRLGWLLVVSRNMEHRYTFLLYVLFVYLNFMIFPPWLAVGC